MSHSWPSSDTLVFDLLRASPVDLGLTRPHATGSLLFVLSLLEAAKLLLTHLLESIKGFLPALAEANVLGLSQEVD